MENQRLDWVEGKETKGAHDIGGLEGEYGAIDRTEKGFHLWEMQVSFRKARLVHLLHQINTIILYDES